MNIAHEARITLQRLLPRLEPALSGLPDRDIFHERLNRYFPEAFELLIKVYGQHYDFFYHLEQIMLQAVRCFAQRPADLKALDQQREANPHWFQNERMLGGVCYVDLFAGNLAGIRQRIPYFRELGLTYLHLMPLFKAPAGNSDGGYAVSSYREVNPALGTMAELADLAHELRQHGISLVVDFVFNHTSDEHDWALKAIAGDETYRGYYYMFPDRVMPDRYEFRPDGQRVLREIFPDQAPGCFTYRPDMKQWVWTTFNTFQWDLNYGNPEVFNAMMGEMLGLANNGVEFLRLDAVAFIWKEMGTGCENLPQVHWLIQAFNVFCRIVAPAMLFKSEAIVHPRDVASYISWEECPVSYNPTLMALCWEALATREVRLLRRSMEHWFNLPGDCAWVNYIRSHDDIGWTFADEDAAELGINGFHHRQFLNQFYVGRFPGSFARGVPFNYNPVNQDMRISGTCASLAGLERGLSDLGSPLEIDHAVKRILLIYSIALSAGGIPLLYLGDEIATRNDYSYQQNPAKAEDSRWVHRPAFDWERAAARLDVTTVEGQVFQGLTRLIAIRQQTSALANGKTQFLDCGNGHVLAYLRNHTLLVLANFSERSQLVNLETLRWAWPLPMDVRDLIDDAALSLTGTLTLEPYQFLWLDRSQVSH